MATHAEREGSPPVEIAANNPKQAERNVVSELRSLIRLHLNTILSV